MTKMAAPQAGRPVALARNGMVATPHYLATQAGVNALARGGSAVDAIITANTVLCAAYPHMAGLGGDCFGLIWDAGAKQLTAINGSGRAAGAAGIEFYRRKGLDTIPSRGPLAAVTVPGAVDGWAAAHGRYGKLPWESLFTQAIDYAERGVPVSRGLARWIARDRDILAANELTAQTYLKNGRPFELGEVLVQANLAASLREVASGGRDAFYKGPIAHEIARYLESRGGLLGLEDFAEHNSDWVEPISTSYRDYQVCTFPPNSQGLALLMILNILDGYDIKSMGDGSADYLHCMAEATRTAFVDRDRWLTDPEFAAIPVSKLISQEYAAGLRRQIRPDKAGSIVAGQEDGPGRKGDTVYLCAVDAEGNCVSFIQSIYHDFGSAVIGGATGIILQNRGSFFSLDPNHVNRLEPRKRTFHTLMPSMVLQEGKPYLVFGTMGGEGQPQTQAAMLTRLVDFGYDVQQAIEAPRWLWGRAWGDSTRSFKVESRFPAAVIDELRRRGHDMEVLDDWTDFMGHAQQIRINPETGVLEGAADPRGDGTAQGY